MEKKRPNIVLILADDMGYSDIGCFGSEIATPHIDSMAGEGVRFTQMYNIARCCPSRAALLTGLHPHQAGVGHMTGNLGLPEYQGYLNDRCVTVAEALKTAGYKTGMSGKWHVGGEYGRSRHARETVGQTGYPTPMQRGYDHFYGTLEGAANYYNPTTLMEDGRWLEVRQEDDFYYTEKIADKACDMIGDFAGTGDPFFVYAAFNAPHWPLHAREKDIKKYEGTYLCGWDEIRKRRCQRQIEMGLTEDIWDISPRDGDAPPWDSVKDKDFEDSKMAVYAAQVEELDRGVGQILDKLRESGAEGNTMVIFLSDNGGCAEELPPDGWVLNFACDETLDGRKVAIGNGSRRRPGGEDTYMSYGLPWANASNTPFRLFKHWIHEGGISTPCVIQWCDKIKDGGQIKHIPLHFTDVMPTILDAAGARCPETIRGGAALSPEGESFLPALTGDWERTKPLFWEHEGNCGMRQGRYKLVRKYPGDFELYDMQSDRTELHDLAGGKPEIVRSMTQSYQDWALRTHVRDWPEPLGQTQEY